MVTDRGDPMRDWRTTLPCAVALLLAASCGGDGGPAGGMPQQPGNAFPLVVVRATSGEIRVDGSETYALILDGVEETSTVSTRDQGSTPVRTDDLVASWQERAVAGVDAALGSGEVELANLRLDLATPSWDPATRILRLSFRVRRGADGAAIDRMAAVAADGRPDFGAVELRIDPTSGEPPVPEMDVQEHLTIRLASSRPGVGTAVISGSFGFYNPELEGLVGRAEAEEYRVVGLDVSRVTGFDSLAVAELAEVIRTLATRRIDGVICGELPVTGTDVLLRVLTTLELAGSCENLAIRPTCFDGIRNGNEADVDCGGSCARCWLGRSCGSGADCTSGTCSADRRCACPDAQTTFEVDSSRGEIFEAAEWSGGTITRSLSLGCGVTVQLPRGRVDGLCGGEGFKVTDVEGFSTCEGTGGALGNGCSIAYCPPAGIPACCNVRPSCSAALNGSARSSYTVRCRG